jgi:catechol 2,3-dioxygenase-like lactoylglutathione lyase family enzyme
MIRPGKLHHAAIRVTDFQTSKKFYEELLGFRALPRPDFPFAGAWYGLGEGQLHLIESPKMGQPIDPTDPHVALEVEDYEATKQVLRERGIEFFELGPQLWIKDPDGYTVELRQKG